MRNLMWRLLDPLATDGGGEAAPAVLETGPADVVASTDFLTDLEAVSDLPEDAAVETQTVSEPVVVEEVPADVSGTQPQVSGEVPPVAEIVDVPARVTAPALQVDVRTIERETASSIQAAVDEVDKQHLEPSKQLYARYQDLETRLKALAEGCTEKDPDTGEVLSRRGYYPEEADERDELRRQKGEVEAESRRRSQQIAGERHAARVKAWANAAPKLDPRLAGYEADLIRLGNTGRIDPKTGEFVSRLDATQTDGRFDTNILLDICDGERRRGAGGTTAAQKQVGVTAATPASVLDNPQLRAKGLARVTAGSGGGGTSMAPATATKDWREGETGSTLASLNQYERVLRGEVG